AQRHEAPGSTSSSRQNMVRRGGHAIRIRGTRPDAKRIGSKHSTSTLGWIPPRTVQLAAGMLICSLFVLRSTKYSLASQNSIHACSSPPPPFLYCPKLLAQPASSSR